MARLTTFSRFLITLAIVGGLFFIGKYVLNNTSAGKKLQSDSKETNTDPFSPFKKNENAGDAIKVGVVTWGGYAGGQYFNEGFKPNANSRFTKEYGIDVDFKILDDFEASRNAFKNGDVDLLWCTIDALPTEIDGLKDYEPQVVFQADWSRGGDAVVTRRGINKVADLRGKKIAVAEMTPSHSFLLWLLEANQMTTKDVQIVPQPSAVDAAQVFKSQQVDAAVVWSPDDEACIKSVPGARVLESTRSASNIIADVFIAKKSFLEKNREKVQKLYEGWMRGAAEINTNDAAKRKAARILAENFPGFTEDDTYKAINNVRLCTHGDNKAFFGLDATYTGVTAENLFARMANTYKGLGYANGKIPSFRTIASLDAINTTNNLNARENASESQKIFAPVTENDKNKEAVATKRVSISFRSGEYQLDENSKYIIDKEFVDIAKAFSNARIRIEGNTDNVGNQEINRLLSKKRAESVANYLINTYKMPRNRFIITGNGSDKPVSGNEDELGRSKNRRTDFEIVSE